jgi:hypothetical protein
MSGLIRQAIILSIPCFILLSACHQEPGDPQKFTELSIDQLTDKNVPKGLMLRDGKASLADGYEAVYASDSSKVLFINTGSSPDGATAMRCDCDGVLKTGCIVVLRGIITCKPLLCTSCKPVLQIYDRRISVEQFRK